MGSLSSDSWRLLLEDEAPLPSQVLSKLDSDFQSKVCGDRGTDISTLLRLVRRDLEGVVLAVLDHRRPLARSPGIARQFKIWSQQNSKTIRGVLNTFLIVAAIAAKGVYWRSWRLADQ